MSSIQPTGGSGVANLPAPSSVTPQQVPQDGLEWGMNVAESVSDPSFNFDNYANTVAASMTTAGFSPSQVSAFINSMYAGYLMDGGTATQQFAGSTGSGQSSAGVVGNPNQWGSLDLPGQNGSNAIEGPTSTQFALSPALATALGQQMGSVSSGVNYQQYTENLQADLQRAGYSQSEVTGFMNAFTAGYASAGSGATSVGTSSATNNGASAASNNGASSATGSGSSASLNLDTSGLQNGAAIAAASLPANFNLETFITGSVEPYLAQRGYSTPAQVNQFVDAFRAAFMANGDSTNMSFVNQGTQMGESLASNAPSGFNLESYISNSLSSSVSNWSAMNPQQQQMYVNAMTAGYLEGGGTQTAAVSSIVTPTLSSATTPASGSGGSMIAGVTSQDADGEAVAASAPAAAVSLYSEYVAGSNPTLMNDANAVQSALSTLSTTQAQMAYAESAYSKAEATGQPVADASGHLQNAGYWYNQVASLQAQQQGAWKNVQTAEGKFYKDLAATSGDSNAAMAQQVYQSFLSDSSYTLEGEMPSTWSAIGISTPAPPSTGAAASTAEAPVSSGALSILETAVSSSALPPNVSNELEDPFASKNINQSDYTSIVEGYEKLYQSNPSLYYQSLAQIKDPNLAGAIAFSVQDMAINNPQDMQANGATASTESAQIGVYWTAMNQSNNTYYAWAPSPSAGTYSGPTSISSIVSGYHDASDVIGILTDPTATTDNKHDEHNYSDAAQAMTRLYHDNPAQYYQALSQIQDPKLRDMINRDVQLEFANPSNKNTYGTDAFFHQADQDFKAEWFNTKNVAGPTAGSTAASAGVGLNTSSTTNGK